MTRLTVTWARTLSHSHSTWLDFECAYISSRRFSHSNIHYANTNRHKAFLASLRSTQSHPPSINLSATQRSDWRHWDETHRRWWWLQKKKLYDERENENEKLILFLLFLILTDQLSIGTPDMSLLTVNSAPFLLSDYCSSIRSSSMSSSLSELASSSLDLASSQHDTLNLEDIKIQLSQCCLTCGVCWKEDHFSFDCTECGGYSMFRPCLTCGGRCGALWTRDFVLVSFWLLLCDVILVKPVHFILSHLILSLSLILLHRVTLFKVQNGRAPATTCSVISTVVRLKRPRVGWVSSRPTHRRHRYAEWVNSWRAIWGIVSRNWR